MLHCSIPLSRWQAVHAVRRVSVENKEASSQLPPRCSADMILPDSDDSEAEMPILSAVPSSCAFTSPHHLDQAIQRELAALATLEAAHRSACRWLDEWSGPKAVKEHVAYRLEARHRTERAAHVLRLAELHQQRMLLAMSDETGDCTDEVSGSPGIGQGGPKLPRLLPPVWMVSP